MKRSKTKIRSIKRRTAYGSMKSKIAAAEGGDLDAQHDVGAGFATGDWDGPQDLAEAIKWYTKAAKSGHTMSQYDLGFMLILGEGTAKDPKAGLAWMEQAATNGFDSAALVLTDLYREGLFGVEPDADKMEYWNQKARDK